MKIAIIGAGIYGCHLALSLKNEQNTIDLYDMADDIFSGASTLNSCRVHKGYHYPRSSITREMCKCDEIAFAQKYPHLITQPHDSPKIFCVANDNKTLIDYGTMKIIMSGASLAYDELSLQALNQLGFDNIEGGFKVYESVFLVDKAKQWFKSELRNKGIDCRLSHPVHNIQSSTMKTIQLNDSNYDIVINCTYSQALQPLHTKLDFYYDLCFSLIVATKSNISSKIPISFGIFDGHYPSLEPYGYSNLPVKYSDFQDRQLFQLFHVQHSSIERFQDINIAREHLQTGLKNSELARTTKKILEHTTKFYPTFLDTFDIIDTQLSLKTKVTDLNDSRPLLVFQDHKQHDRLIQIFSSKLTSIMSAEKQVKSIIQQLNTSENKNTSGAWSTKSCAMVHAIYTQ